MYDDAAKAVVTCLSSLLTLSEALGKLSGVTLPKKVLVASHVNFELREQHAALFI